MKEEEGGSLELKAAQYPCPFIGATLARAFKVNPHSTPAGNKPSFLYNPIYVHFNVTVCIAHKIPKRTEYAEKLICVLPTIFCVIDPQDAISSQPDASQV
jgi:hypothetical protein